MTRSKEIIDDFGAVVVNICLESDPETIYHSETFDDWEEAEELISMYLINDYVYVQPPDSCLIV